VAEQFSWATNVGQVNNNLGRNDVMKHQRYKQITIYSCLFDHPISKADLSIED